MFETLYELLGIHSWVTLEILLNRELLLWHAKELCNTYVPTEFPKFHIGFNRLYTFYISLMPVCLQSTAIHLYKHSRIANQT